MTYGNFYGAGAAGPQQGPELGPGTSDPFSIAIGTTSSKSLIKHWQRFLGSKGYNLGSACVDGDFGSKTQQGTKDWASARGMSWTQYAPGGEVTQALLNLSMPLGFTAMATTELTAAQRQQVCPPSTSSSSSYHSPAATGGAGSPLGGMQKWEPRTLGLIGGGVLVLVGLVGVFMRRRGRGNEHYALYDPEW